MTIDELLAEIVTRDIQLRRSGNELILLGKDSLDASMVAELRIHKTTLFGLIGRDSDLWWSPPARITPEMLSLVQLTADEIDAIVGGVPGGVGNVQDIYPLAPLQEGIFFHHLMGEEGDPYLLASKLSFDSRLRMEAYVGALQAVINRHDILRTAVMWEGLSEPVQVVWRNAVLPVEEVELYPAACDVEEQLYVRFNPRHYRMDLRQAPLLRVAVAHDKENERWFMIQLLHHLAGDHSTLAVMQEEIQAHLLGKADTLPAPLPFRNLVAQARLGVSEEEHEAFFRQLLGDVDEPTAPFGLLDIQGDGTGIEEARITLVATLARRIREHARKLGVSPASLCHLAWAQVLARVSGREDVVFGTVLFGRMEGETGGNRALGLFINTLPVRIQPGAEGVEASVRRTHKLLADLMRHEHASLALAQRCSAVPAPLPLFSALLNYRHSAGTAQAHSEEGMQAWEGIQRSHGEERTNYPLTLSVGDLGQGFNLTAQVRSGIEPMHVCEYMSTALESLVNALESAPATAMRTLKVLPEAERRQVLYEWNDTAAEYPGQECVHELFEVQVGRTPEAPAVVCEDASLSYVELNRRANRLAHYLRELGVRPDVRVAICMERGLEMMVALLAVLKAGGAYVPLDPSYPVERLQFMLEDSTPAVLLMQGQLAGLLAGCRQTLPVLDLTVPVAWSGQPETNLERAGIGLTGRHLAYVIYTSGSTGTPKGVAIEHRSLANLIGWHWEAFALKSGQGASSVAGFGFDAATWEIWPALCVGAVLRLPSPATARDPEALVAWWKRQKLDVSFLPTPMAEFAFTQGITNPQLHTLLVGGDVLRRLPRQTPTFSLVNNYGPTEATVVATSGRIELTDTVVSIGRPISNTRVYILDGQGEPVPVGVAGELYIGGAGVARGYLNRPELTAERFLKDPFVEEAGARVYKTGDQGRWQGNGTIEFLGRKDSQVKIRGFRIELGEIEARLAEHPGVGEAVVVTREDTDGEKRLVVYYTGVPVGNRDLADQVDGGLGAEILRSHLAQKLPAYMVPSAYVRLEFLPLTPNGKLDRKALPTPEADAYATRGYEAPQGEIETLLAAIWAEVLKLERVGRHDNFFQLGGHSLLAVTLIERMRQSGLQVDVRMMFETPTLAQLAAEQIQEVRL